LNRKTGRLIPDAEIDYSSKRSPLNTIACPDGTFSLKIPKGIPFAIVPHMPGYIGQADTISLRRDYAYFGDQYVDIFMDPMKKDDKIELRPIYFQQSEAIILTTSLPELRRLAQVLKDNPNIHIRIEGHTDNIGKATDLMQLSHDRADAIKAFLNKEGIELERMETIGHGPKFPINENDSDDKRALNRRVEIYVTKN
jgi:outer membrane protein OmpA-like peptidoglycan-associated protein